MCKVLLTSHGLILSEEWMGGGMQGRAQAERGQGGGTAAGI